MLPHTLPHHPRLAVIHPEALFLQDRCHGHTEPFDMLFKIVVSRKREVSSPGEFHPEALSELYMNLSAHTAPTMEPRRTPICQ